MLWYNIDIKARLPLSARLNKCMKEAFQAYTKRRRLTMVSFKKLTLSDIDKIRPYFMLSKTRTCDNTVGGAFMWRDFFCEEYAIINDTMLFKLNYLNNQTAFTMPLGKDVFGALHSVADYCLENDMPMIICSAAESDVMQLKTQFSVEAVKEENWSDYLYLASDLANMKGKKYNGQRNHINRFMRENTSYEFRVIDESNIGDIISFFNSFNMHNVKDTPIFIEEREKVYEVLNNYDCYGQTGLVLYAENSIAAFSVGEVIGDTLYVHIEKADTDVEGAYQMIVREFAASNLQNGIVYVNREEDVGDEGLRTSKLSYHPCELIDKYTVKVKHE